MQDFKLFTPDPPMHSVVPRIASLVHSFLNIFTAIFLILQISWKEEPSMFCRHFFGGTAVPKKIGCNITVVCHL